MKRLGWLILLAVAAIASAKTSQAQVAIYGEGTADYLNNGPYTNYLYGGTGGVLIDVAQFWHDRLTLSADLQDTFVFDYNAPPKYSGGNSPGESYNALTIGPRISLAPSLYKLAPFIQANVGFARYGDPTIHSSTDSVIGGQAGVTRQLTPRLDVVLDYSYTYFGYNAGYYSPQAFSAGVLFHFAKR